MIFMTHQLFSSTKIVEICITIETFECNSNLLALDRSIVNKHVKIIRSENMI